MNHLWQCENGKSFWEGFWKRTIVHTINLVLAIVISYILIIGLWWIFFENKMNFKNISILAVVIGVWVSTLRNLVFRLPHYNIPDCYSDSARTTIYIIDFIGAVAVICIVLSIILT